MIFNNLTAVAKQEFPSWIKLVPGRDGGERVGATVVFPHAGGAAVGYRKFATALAAGGDTYIVQYPQRADRLTDPAAEHRPGSGPRVVRGRSLASGSAAAAVRSQHGRRRRIRVRQNRRITRCRCGAAVGIGGSGAVGGRRYARTPTSHDELILDIADLGGTDADLLADPEFAELLVTAMRADYQAVNRYTCDANVRIRADISALGARDDHRVERRRPRLWGNHTAGAFDLSWFDGGHFYLDDHIDAVAAQVNADG